MARRYVFLILALAIVIPLLKPIGFKINAGENVIKLFQFIEKLPRNSRIYLSFDYDPSSMPELHPAAVALIVHSLRLGHRPICSANWPLGGEMAEVALKKAVQLCGSGTKVVDGINYSNLGFQPGVLSKIKVMCNDFLSLYQADKSGKSTSGMPIFETGKTEKMTLKDFSLIVSFSAGPAGLSAFIATSGEHGVPVAGGCTSVSIPDYITFIQTGQLVGLIGGMPGSAEYESLIGIVSDATKSMDSQSMAHLAIILLIIAGNIIQYKKRGSVNV
ncbi:MAG: hypothetical protein HQM10_16100 [Candidatus Riflebacteria bacterium]|nr:hypothetical protein [Candidatus Riflebacteria bacterium]